MKHIKLLMCIGLSFAITASAQTFGHNFCYNGDFTLGDDHLEGWNLNYDWTGISLQQGNHLNASFLPHFRGKRNVMRMNVPKGYESKIECKLIPYKAGERYKCTFDIYIENVNMKMLFNGYRFKPGIRPYDDPKLQDLRRIYKSDQKNMKKGSGWKRKTMFFPTESRVSATAYRHLKKVRYISTFFYVPGHTYTEEGNFYLANVKITKLPGEVSVK
ncbi:MAG: hypothetical protein R6V06_09765 [Kiritimatiellia bacterium]